MQYLCKAVGTISNHAPSLSHLQIHFDASTLKKLVNICRGPGQGNAYQQNPSLDILAVLFFCSALILLLLGGASRSSEVSRDPPTVGLAWCA
eukprot:48768-Amphidinium_carterae.1